MSKPEDDAFEQITNDAAVVLSAEEGRRLFARILKICTPVNLVGATTHETYFLLGRKKAMDTIVNLLVGKDAQNMGLYKGLQEDMILPEDFKEQRHGQGHDQGITGDLPENEYQDDDETSSQVFSETQ